MSEKIAITYETLFDFVRREKGRDDLQKIEASFYNDLQKYIHEKWGALTNVQVTDNVFAADERLKLQKQLDNIKLLVKELYERREKKIISLALIKSRTQSSIIDTSALLEEEKPLFQQLCDILSGHRVTILQQTQNYTPNTLSQKSSPSLQQKEMATISFLHYVPKFVGRDLEVYGPFEPGNTTTLPRELALVLIAKGRAKEISEKMLPTE